MEDFSYFAYAGSTMWLEVVENTRMNKYFAGLEFSLVNAARR